jgi:hypothetical protein
MFGSICWTSSCIAHPTCSSFNFTSLDYLCYNFPETKMPSTCPGCTKTFSTSGLLLHLCSTRQPACRTAANALDALFEESTDEEMDVDVGEDSMVLDEVSN